MRQMAVVQEEVTRTIRVYFDNHTPAMPSVSVRDLTPIEARQLHLDLGRALEMIERVEQTGKQRQWPGGVPTAIAPFGNVARFTPDDRDLNPRDS